MAHELLATACVNEDFEQVGRILQDEHADVDVDYQGYFSDVKDTLLLRAAELGEPEIVKLLLERGADANLEIEGRTPLSVALEKCHWEIAKTLLMHEDLDVCTFNEENEWSPLHLAVKGDRVEIVRLILDKDPSCIDQRDKLNRTPLDLAFEKDARNCVRILLKRGARTWRRPPLSEAARLGHLDFMRQSLRLKQAVDEPDQDGWTPLHYAAVRRCDRAIKLLVSKNADPNWPNKDTLTPLHLAVETWWVDKNDGDSVWARSPHLETVQELLACTGLNVNAVTKDGWSALHYAVDQAWDDCVGLLLERKADINIQDKDGQTPLVLAINPRLPEGAEPILCVRKLINAGADANAVTKDGETALHRAINVDSDRTAYELAELLLKEGKANVNCVTKSNETPLSAAIKCGHHQVVELLLAFGADMAASPTPNHSLSRPHALAVLMREVPFPADCFVAIARSLCARGAKWDESCDGEVRVHARSAKWDDWCSGMRASVEHWAKQFERGGESLTDILVEAIQRGAKSVGSYLDRAAGSPSKALLRRCKICVVGPTEWGKTTLVKALTTGKDARVDPGADGRTVGIDLEPLEFTCAGIRHEVMLWDFAGQNEYQGAHSLFFSPKSLYLLCVDLKKYHDALQTNNKNAMNKFVRDNIFRWVRAVTMRHKKPKIVAVGTKLDHVEHSDVKKIWKDLEHRWTQAFDFGLVKTIVVNKHDVRVLEWICSKRSEAEARSVADRVGSVMWHPGRLQNQLLEDIPDLRKVEDILKLLHDLGDVYWHESDLREGTIVIDPSLLLEFVKEIITHNCDKDADEETKKNLEEGRVCHESLSEFPHWKCLAEDDELMLDLKCLLQQLRLAYPDNDKKMEWNSDLIVPAYWKRLDRKPSKGLLRDRSVVKRRGAATTFEYWVVYKLPPELSDVVFEQFAVQNRMYSKRVISRNMIEDSIDECVATATLEHVDLSTTDDNQAPNQEADSAHAKTSRHGHREEPKILDTINLQVTGSHRAQQYLLFIVDAMEKVLEEYVGVSRFVKDPTRKKDHEWKDLRKEVKHFDLLGKDFFSLKPWVPPNFKAFTDDPRERRFLLLEEGMTRLYTQTERPRARDTRQFVEAIDNNKVLENLLRTTESERHYPTRWTLTYDKTEDAAKLCMLCDSQEKCPQDLKPFTIRGSDFLAKHSTVMKGCAWLMTVFKKVVTLGLLDELVDKLVSDFQAKIDKSEKIDEMVSLLDLSEGGATLVGEMVSGPIAAWFLHEFLKLHQPSFEVKDLPHLSGLSPTINDQGKCIWVHPSCVSHGQSEDSDAPVLQPEEENDPSSDASSVKKTFSVRLRSLRITGLNPRDERKVFVHWALEDPRHDPSGATKVFCAGTTPLHLDESHAPSWEDMHVTLRKIASLKQLAECNLRVEVKRPPHWLRREEVTRYSGTTFLASHVGNLEDDANPRTVDFVVELAKKKKVSMKYEQVQVRVELELT